MSSAIDWKSVQDDANNWWYHGNFFDDLSGNSVNSNNGFEAIDSALDNYLTGNRDWQRTLQLAEYNNAFNAAEAQKQRDWEEKMANTAIQRGVIDARSVGLNPYYSVLNSAPTPSGAVANSHYGYNGSGGNIGSLLGSLISSAFSYASSALYGEALENVAHIRAAAYRR